MTELRKALIAADKAMEELREAIQHKETLVISEDEEKVYRMLHNKYSDIMTLINYIGGHQYELGNKTKKDTL